MAPTSHNFSSSERSKEARKPISAPPSVAGGSGLHCELWRGRFVSTSIQPCQPQTPGLCISNRLPVEARMWSPPVQHVASTWCDTGAATGQKLIWLRSQKTWLIPRLLLSKYTTGVWGCAEQPAPQSPASPGWQPGQSSRSRISRANNPDPWETHAYSSIPLVSWGCFLVGIIVVTSHRCDWNYVLLKIPCVLGNSIHELRFPLYFSLQILSKYNWWKESVMTFLDKVS